MHLKNSITKQHSTYSAHDNRVIFVRLCYGQETVTEHRSKDKKTCIKRSPFETNKKWPYKTSDLLKEF